MNNMGIYVELKDGKLKKTNFELFTLAHKSGFASTAIIFTDDVSPYLSDLKSFGIQKVLNITGEQNYNVDLRAENLANIVKGNRITDLIATFSAQGKDFLPRVAAKLDAALVTDCIGVDFKNATALKPMYAGKVTTQLKVKGEPRLYSFRPNTVEVARTSQPSEPQVSALTGSWELPLMSHIKEVIKGVSAKVDLTEAQIIVSGGRALGKKESFNILYNLADVLGASVGASRAAVDAGYANQDIQIGQTGKVVNPTLYIACGISGAVQHFAGMKTSKFIVAINLDPKAPIFEKADYGIVGDLFEVVPLLTNEFKKVLGR